MEFRQLEAFKMIADTGSFSEIAKLMNITQPTVSAQISALEREFGCQLLSRQPGNVAATETGMSLYKYAAKILELRNKAVAAFGRHQEMGGNIVVAASSIPYQFVLPIMTAQFSMKYPDAAFTLISGNSARVAELVSLGKAEIGMAGTVCQDRRLTYEAILEDELMAVTPVSQPFAAWKKTCVGTEDILSAPFVAREEGSGTWTELEHYLGRQGYEAGALKIVARMDNPDAIVKAVEHGMGITVLSSLAASEYNRRGNVFVFPLAGTVKRKIYLVRRKGSKAAVVTEAFARFVSRRED